MGTISVNRLAGLSLIFGPIIAFVFFLIEPGGLLIDSATASDAVGCHNGQERQRCADQCNQHRDNPWPFPDPFGPICANAERNLAGQRQGTSFRWDSSTPIFVGLTGWILSGGPGFHSGRCPDLAKADQGKRSRLLRPAQLYSTPVGWRLGFGGFILCVGPLHERRLQPDNLPVGRPCQPGRNGLLHDSHTQATMAATPCLSLARGCYVLLVIWYGYLGFSPVGLSTRMPASAMATPHGIQSR